ncbi:MAG TPA: hypothetical protein VGB73_11160 [Pyrinomonadaceae bacterium]|jgi:hypothetical protein
MFSITSFAKKHFLIVALFLVLILVGGWIIMRLGSALYVVNETFNVTLANDAETGAYLGEVVGELRDQKSKKVVSYRIKRNDGSVLERRSESVVTFKP